MEQLTPTILKEAADWFARLQDDDEPGYSREEFDRWLLRSPAHIEAYLNVSQTWGDAALVRGDGYGTDELVAAARAQAPPGNVQSIRRTDPQVNSRGRGLMHRYAALAATLAVIVVGAILWARPERIATVVGEQRSIPLPDGSLALLNTDSELKLRYSDAERRLDLAHGEARFTVAKSPALPFIVVTPQARVLALGTIFNVQASADRTAVTVIDGEVAVSNRRLHKGEHVVVTRKGVLASAGPSLEHVQAWPQRQLVFRENTLAEVVAEFNRYHREPIRIEDSALATLRISAVFDSNDSASLIQYLERYRDVRAMRKDDGEVYLFPGRPLLGVSEKN